jgi:hypothetical protein
MTSPAQIAANRRNAQKSTGPKTDAGKEAVSHNALKHGLRAQDVVCTDESSREYEAFAASLIADLAPADNIEEQLAQRIVTCTWRLLRMVNAEATMFDSWRMDEDDALAPTESSYSRRFENSNAGMSALSRYEASLDRSLNRAYALLDRRQARRRGGPVSAPITVQAETAAGGAPVDSAKPLTHQADFENCRTKPMLDPGPETSRTES